MRSCLRLGRAEANSTTGEMSALIWKVVRTGSSVSEAMSNRFTIGLQGARIFPFFPNRRITLRYNTILVKIQLAEFQSKRQPVLYVLELLSGLHWAFRAFHLESKQLSLRIETIKKLSTEMMIGAVEEHQRLPFGIAGTPDLADKDRMIAHFERSHNGAFQVGQHSVE